MRELLYGVFFIFAMLLAIALIVVGLSKVVDPRPSRSPTDDYQEECIRIGGRPLWNGRRIECLQVSKS